MKKIKNETKTIMMMMTAALEKDQAKLRHPFVTMGGKHDVLSTVCLFD